MVEEKNNILDSGFTRYQAYSALKKARTAYERSRKENNEKGKKHCACAI